MPKVNASGNIKKKNTPAVRRVRKMKFTKTVIVLKSDMLLRALGSSSSRKAGKGILKKTSYKKKRNTNKDVKKSGC